MERICTCCNKTIRSDEAVQFCPYCGTSMTQTNTSKAHNNVAWKIETTWGNQANYADKVKRIGGELISRIRTWIMEQETFIEGRNPAEFVTAQQLRDDFAFLRASSDTEEFEQEYRSLLRALKKVCHGEKILRTNRVAYVDMDMQIRENLHLFEAMVGISAYVNKDIPEIADEESLNIKKVTDFDYIFDVMDQAFACVKTIIQNQGFLCVQNCNFDSEKIRLLNDCLYTDNQGALHYDFQGIVDELGCSCKHDFSDPFDEKYEDHLVMFFEGLWLLCQGILERFQPETDQEDAETGLDYIEEWLSSFEVSVDRAKYNPNADMTEIYLTARKAYSVVKKNFS